MDCATISEEGTENLTSNTENLNITGYTSNISNIEHLGNNPDHWLLALRELEQIENGSRKRKLLKHFFVQSGKMLDSVALRHNRTYAILLGKEALFYGELDAEDARSMFEMALTLCQKSSVLYLMFAQFELDQGRKNKALKILRHGEICIGVAPELTAAKIKVERGCMKIGGGMESKSEKILSPLQDITNNPPILDLQDKNAITAEPRKMSTHARRIPLIETMPLENLSALPNFPTLRPSVESAPSRQISHSAKNVSEVFSVPSEEITPCQEFVPMVQNIKDEKNRLSSFPVFATPELKSNFDFKPTPELTPTPQVNTKSLQTPPQNKLSDVCKSLNLNLTFQSPVLPDTCMTSLKKKLSLSNLTSDILPIGQSVNKALLSQSALSLGSTISTLHGEEKDTKPPSSMSATRSEKKSSPVSRIIQKNCQTTGKKPTRMQQPMRIPRRVLIKDSDSNSDNDLESDFADAKPIDKSPVNIKTEASVPLLSSFPQIADTIAQRSEHDIIIDKENLPFPRSVVSANEKHQNISPKYLPKKQTPNSSAFQPYTNGQAYQQSNLMQQQINSQMFEKPNKGPLSSHPVSNGPTQVNPHHAHETHLNSTAAVQQLPCVNQQSQNVYSSGVHVGNNVHPMQPPNYAHHPHHYSRLQTPSYEHGKILTHPYTGHVSTPPPRIHPAHRLLQEKKILEINGKAYILLKILGKGGSSKVYQVLDPVTSEISAIKQVNLAGCESSVLEGYKNEIQFLKKLQGSRHIIRMLDYEIRDTHLYLVMECGSLDLSAFLKKQKAERVELDIIHILAFWKNMLRAVEIIHKHGVIHLDLKPANFMLVDYTLKLIDFGIANSIQVDATSIIKDTQFGTLNYMAPETINDMSGGCQSGSSMYTPKFRVSPKADVWSLGCILYYIMYGKTPFQDIHHQGMKFYAITSENHKIEFPDFPQKQLIEIVQACLIRDAKKRPSVEILLKHPLLN